MDANATPPLLLRELPAQEGRRFALGEVADGLDARPRATATITLAADGRTAELRSLDGESEAAEQLLRRLARRLCADGVRRIEAALPAPAPEQRATLHRAGFTPHLEL